MQLLNILTIISLWCFNATTNYVEVKSCKKQILSCVKQKTFPVSISQIREEDFVNCLEKQ